MDYNVKTEQFKYSKENFQNNKIIKKRGKELRVNQIRKCFGSQRFGNYSFHAKFKYKMIYFCLKKNLI